LYALQGWGLHLASAVSEWIIGLSVILFFLTFTFEFGKIKLRLVAEAVNSPPAQREANETTPLIT